MGIPGNRRGPYKKKKYSEDATSVSVASVEPDTNAGGRDNFQIKRLLKNNYNDIEVLAEHKNELRKLREKGKSIEERAAVERKYQRVLLRINRRLQDCVDFCDLPEEERIRRDNLSYVPPNPIEAREYKKNNNIYDNTNTNNNNTNDNNSDTSSYSDSDSDSNIDDDGKNSAKKATKKSAPPKQPLESGPKLLVDMNLKKLLPSYQVEGEKNNTDYKGTFNRIIGDYDKDIQKKRALEATTSSNTSPKKSLKVTTFNNFIEAWETTENLSIYSEEILEKLKQKYIHINFFDADLEEYRQIQSVSYKKRGKAFFVSTLPVVNKVLVNAIDRVEDYPIDEELHKMIKQKDNTSVIINEKSG